MTQEEFVTKIEAIPDQQLAEMAQSALSKLCSTGGKSFTMTVPPRIDDTDIILSEVINRLHVIKSLPLDFVKWYSGMEQQKILNAYERWKRECVNKTN